MVVRRVEWSAGRQHALVLGDAVLLLGHDVPREHLVAIWDRLTATEVAGLGTLLEILAEVTGAALSSLPDFAMVVLDDKGLHVAARGGCHVRVAHTDGTELDLRGAEVSTWLERNVDTTSAAQVSLGAGVGGESWLPVVGGVVPAGAVRLLVADHALLDERGEPSRPVEVMEGVPVEVPVEIPVEIPAAVAVPSAETLAEPEPEPAPEVEVEVEVEVEEPADAAPGPPVADAPPSRLAHMYTPHTVLHDIEDAAVRAEDDDDIDGRRDEPAEPVAPVQAVVVEPVVVEAVAPVEVVAVAPRPAPSPEPAGPAAFISGVPSAAPARPAVAEPSSTAGSDGEHHDGHTLLEAPDSTEIDVYLASGGEAPDGQETVLGVLCPSGHANPTHRPACRVCGLRLAGEGVRMPRPGLGWLVTSAGEQIELVRNVLAGRNPQASRIQGPVLPRLLPLPHSHVSGTHLEIRLEGWSVMVVDLDSTNGTFLQRPGQPTVRISRSPQLLTSDDVVQLGHGVDLRFEALP
jgi:hypothetical protein